MYVGMAEGMTEPDVAAAQGLLELSWGEEAGDDYNDNNKEKDEGEVSRPQTMVTRKEDEVAMDEEKDQRPWKRRRFRSVAELYKVTEPIELYKVTEPIEVGPYETKRKGGQERQGSPKLERSKMIDAVRINEMEGLHGFRVRF